MTVKPILKAVLSLVGLLSLMMMMMHQEPFSLPFSTSHYLQSVSQTGEIVVSPKEERFFAKSLSFSRDDLDGVKFICVDSSACKHTIHLFELRPEVSILSARSVLERDRMTE